MRLPTVRQHMDTYVHTLSADTPILDAVQFMLDRRVTGAPVVTESMEVVGILTEKDCLELLTRGRLGQEPNGTVADYMTRDVVTVPPQMDIYYAAGLFIKHHFRRLVVVEDGRIIGAITRFDLLRTIRDNYCYAS